LPRGREKLSFLNKDIPAKVASCFGFWKMAPQVSTPGASTDFIQLNQRIRDPLLVCCQPVVRR
jgi:hypothetical protein